MGKKQVDTTKKPVHPDEILKLPSTKKGIKKTEPEKTAKKLEKLGYKKKRNRNIKCLFLKKIYSSKCNSILPKKVLLESDLVLNSQIPPSPKHVSIKNYIKTRLETLVDNQTIADYYKYIKSYNTRNDEPTIESLLTDENSEDDKCHFRIEFSSVALILSAIDLFSQKLFSNVGYLLKSYKPNAKVYKKQTISQIFDDTNNRTQNIKTLNINNIYNAFLKTISDNGIGPKEDQTISEILSVFSICKQGSTEVIQEKIKKQYETNIYKMTSFFATVKRYGITRKSKSVKILFECIIRSFLDEILRKIVRVIVVHKFSPNITESLVKYALTNCGFK